MRWNAKHAKCFRNLSSKFEKSSIQVALYSVLFICLVQEASGAPITFRFEAEIGRVFPGIPFDSGIEFAEGDGISGRFTFEPANGDGSMLFEAQQPHEFTLNINGIAFSAPSFEIEAVNNTTIDDFPPPSDVDWLVLGAGGLSPRAPANLPNIDPATSGFRMTLYGPAVVLGQAGIPGGVETWNQFDLWRQIKVSFENGEGGAVGFQATVSSFSIVPEPPSHLLIVLAFAVVFAYPLRSFAFLSDE